MKRLYKIILLVLSFSIFTCQQKPNSDKDNETIEVEVETINNKPNNNEDVIFYNMFSPVDLEKIIDAKSSYYNSVYINSLNHITKYGSSQKIALNTGVYGADLSYLWMFEQTQQALSYLSAIQHLTSKLGIPNSFVESTFKIAETHANQQDSLIHLVRKAYGETNVFLKNSDRESDAILILLGGWIETLHIALNMYTAPDSRFASKIITQKYSLSSLINMVQNTQDDIIMSEYLLLLKKLQHSFNALDIKLKPNDVLIDTANKQIIIKNAEHLNIQPEQFEEIKTLTAKIRSHIIS